MTVDTDSRLMHATAVSWEGRGLLLTGPSGSGKSGLALGLMSFGAGLICDDQVRLERRGQQIWLLPAPNLQGLIEARGIGLLNADAAAPAPLDLVVDLETPETERLPPQREIYLLGQSVNLLRAPPSSYFLQGLLQYLKAGRRH